MLDKYFTPYEEGFDIGYVEGLLQAGCLLARPWLLGYRPKTHTVQEMMDAELAWEARRLDKQYPGLTNERFTRKLMQESEYLFCQ